MIQQQVNVIERGAAAQAQRPSQQLAGTGRLALIHGLTASLREPGEFVYVDLARLTGLELVAIPGPQHNVSGPLKLRLRFK